MATRCHSLYLAAIRFDSLLLALPLVVVVPLAVIRGHLLSLVVTHCTIRCLLLPLDMPLVCLLIKDLLILQWCHLLLSLLTLGSFISKLFSLVVPKCTHGYYAPR